MERVENDFDFDKAEDLRHENGRFGSQFEDAGKGNRVAAKFVSHLMDFVNRMQHVQPDV
jgi:hypothetical protein